MAIGRLPRPENPFKIAAHSFRKNLPYGHWTCHDGRRVLFDRWYRPIAEHLPPNPPVMLSADLWIPNIISHEWLYDDGVEEKEKLKRSKKALKTWNILDEGLARAKNPPSARPVDPALTMPGRINAPLSTVMSRPRRSPNADPNYDLAPSLAAAFEDSLIKQRITLEDGFDAALHLLCDGIDSLPEDIRGPAPHNACARIKTRYGLFDDPPQPAKRPEPVK